jgi:hypothetical protein
MLQTPFEGHEASKCGLTGVIARNSLCSGSHCQRACQRDWVKTLTGKSRLIIANFSLASREIQDHRNPITWEQEHSIVNLLLSQWLYDSSRFSGPGKGM